MGDGEAVLLDSRSMNSAPSMTPSYTSTRSTTASQPHPQYKTSGHGSGGSGGHFYNNRSRSQKRMGERSPPDMSLRVKPTGEERFRHLDLAHKSFNEDASTQTESRPSSSSPDENNVSTAASSVVDLSTTGTSSTVAVQTGASSSSSKSVTSGTTVAAQTVSTESSSSTPAQSPPAFPDRLPAEMEELLTFDLNDLYQRLLPTTDTFEIRMNFVNKIQAIVDSEWPDRDIKAHLFGSSVNGLGSESSDVDIVLMTTWDDREHGVANMHVLAELLKRNGMKQIYTVTKAKVPICKFFDPETYLSCDINVNSMQALPNTHLIWTYVETDPRVRPLVMVIKHWAKRRVLNDAAKGGTLSSYCWVMMVLNFLQMRDPPILPSLHEMYFEQLKNYPENVKQNIIDGVDCTFFDDLSVLRGHGDANHETLGGLLYAFFHRYTVTFDYDHDVVSVRHGRLLSKRERGWHVDIERMCRFLCVEEPFNPSRNLANSADGVSVAGLREEFERALSILARNGDLDEMCEQFEFPHASTGNGGYYNQNMGFHHHTPLHHHPHLAQGQAQIPHQGYYTGAAVGYVQGYRPYGHPQTLIYAGVPTGTNGTYGGGYNSNRMYYNGNGQKYVNGNGAYVNGMGRGRGGWRPRGGNNGGNSGRGKYGNGGMTGHPGGGRGGYSTGYGRSGWEGDGNEEELFLGEADEEEEDDENGGRSRGSGRSWRGGFRGESWNTSYRNPRGRDGNHFVPPLPPDETHSPLQVIIVKQGNGSDVIEHRTVTGGVVEDDNEPTLEEMLMGVEAAAAAAGRSTSVPARVTPVALASGDDEESEGGEKGRRGRSRPPRQRTFQSQQQQSSAMPMPIPAQQQLSLVLPQNQQMGHYMYPNTAPVYPNGWGVEPLLSPPIIDNTFTSSATTPGTSSPTSWPQSPPYSGWSGATSPPSARYHQGEGSALGSSPRTRAAWKGQSYNGGKRMSVDITGLGENSGEWGNNLSRRGSGNSRGGFRRRSQTVDDSEDKGGYFQSSHFSSSPRGRSMAYVAMSPGGTSTLVTAAAAGWGQPTTEPGSRRGSAVVSTTPTGGRASSVDRGYSPLGHNLSIRRKREANAAAAAAAAAQGTATATGDVWLNRGWDVVTTDSGKAWVDDEVRPGSGSGWAAGPLSAPILTLDEQEEDLTNVAGSDLGSADEFSASTEASAASDPVTTSITAARLVPARTESTSSSISQRNRDAVDRMTSVLENVAAAKAFASAKRREAEEAAAAAAAAAATANASRTSLTQPQSRATGRPRARSSSVASSVSSSAGSGGRRRRGNTNANMATLVWANQQRAEANQQRTEAASAPETPRTGRKRRGGSRKGSGQVSIVDGQASMAGEVLQSPISPSNSTTKFGTVAEGAGASGQIAEEPSPKVAKSDAGSVRSKSQQSDGEGARRASIGSTSTVATTATTVTAAAQSLAGFRSFAAAAAAGISRGTGSTASNRTNAAAAPRTEPPRSKSVSSTSSRPSSMYGGPGLTTPQLYATVYGMPESHSPIGDLNEEPFAFVPVPAVVVVDDAEKTDEVVVVEEVEVARFDLYGGSRASSEYGGAAERALSVSGDESTASTDGRPFSYAAAAKESVAKRYKDAVTRSLSTGSTVSSSSAVHPSQPKPE